MTATATTITTTTLNKKNAAPPKTKPTFKSLKKGYLFVGFDQSDINAFGGALPYGNEVAFEFTPSTKSAWHLLGESLKEDNLFTKKTLPQAIICNFQLLKKDDFKLLEQVSQNPFFKSIPFITVSLETQDAEGDKREAFWRGADDFYVLPMEWNRLTNRVNFLRQIKLIQSRREDAEAPRNFQYHMSAGKRLFDILLASCALLVLSPILLLIAIIVKLESKGSVLYISKRVGTGYKVFDFYKFRSMRQGADAELKKLTHLNQYDGDKEQATFVKINNDPRVTLVGKILRKTSLDELPQLFNVIKGDMSLVGNRPLPLYEARMLTRDQWAQRFLAPAGITGLWQVTKRGKNDMSVEERVKLDVTYAKKHSFWYDISIIFKTLPAMIQKEAV